MKKFLLAAAAIVAGYVAWLEIQRNRQDRAVWTEVTDPIA
ncbi:DLW-39 family protein [Actinomycetaceae bacterium L2_0104]